MAAQCTVGSTITEDCEFHWDVSLSNSNQMNELKPTRKNDISFFSSAASSVIIHSGPKIWNLSAWLKRKKGYIREISKGKCRDHSVPAAPTGIWELQPVTSLRRHDDCADMFLCRSANFCFVLIFLTLTTNKDQTQKPVIIPIPKRHMDELVSWSLLEWLWPEVHLSAAHWGRKKKQKKRTTAALCYSRNCPDFNRARNHTAPNWTGTKNIYVSGPERITVCALPIFSLCLPPNGTWAFSGFLARGRFVPAQRPYSKNVSCYPCLLQDIRNNLHYVWWAALTLFSFDVQKY